MSNTNIIGDTDIYVLADTAFVISLTFRYPTRIINFKCTFLTITYTLIQGNSPNMLTPIFFHY